MKVIISTGKNISAGDHLRTTIEKKMKKLDKFFPGDTTANIKLTEDGSRDKMEATIQVRNMIFRAEDRSGDFYSEIDKVVDKLASQMSRFKKKLQKKHKDNRDIAFDEWPEDEDQEEVGSVVRTKSFDLDPMTVDEAALRMELLGHDFYVFLNVDTDKVNVVYKRADNNYGVLETNHR